MPGDLAGTIGNLELSNAYIGNGGFSGMISDTWTPPLSAQFFGLEFTLENVSLTFVQNTLTQSEINGTITLPFFDEPVDVEIGINLDGGVAVKLARDSGLYTLTKLGILRLELDSLGFEVEDGVFTAKLSGQVTPLFGDLDWPRFQVKELAIDSEGNVRLEGGWLDLREQYSLDFHGFQMEITKLGFGKTEDGGKWIGFSGGLKLVDGLSAGASVEGLRITWYDDEHKEITFNGVGVEFEVPEVLRFKGAVCYEETNEEFAGEIKLDLIALNLQVDGKLVFGRQSGDTYMALYLATELPAGIPLWSTGLALYGMAGLFTHQMEPDKGDDQAWYGPGGDSWYHSGTPGATDLVKWRYEQGSLALGAGITIGTVSDNGYAFSGRMLLVIVLPGPIIMIEGKANLLKERAQLSGGEPAFRTLGVLDGRAGTFLFGLDAQYKLDKSGKLIDIRGGVEAFFDFHDYSAWHLYLGEKEPRENRIRAEIFQLFEAETYWMLDAYQLAMGAWVGYDKHWQFGPLSVDVEAWAEGNAVVSRKPAHFHGELWLHGSAKLSVWGFGTSLTVDARIAADVFDPFHVLGKLSVGIGLPWPLPDFEEDIPLEWGPEPIPPPLPLPLKEIAIEHLKVTTNWPLPRGTLLLPNYELLLENYGEDSFRQDPETDPSDIEDAPPPASAPVVPLDCRPHLTFGRVVHDDARVGVNPQPPIPEWERIGDPATNKGPVRVRYGLKEVVLEKWLDPGWDPMARKGAVLDPDPPPMWKVDPNPPGVEELFGSWAPVPAMPHGGGKAVAQTKLWIWSKTPFDYTRHTGRAWDEWFTDRFDDYPCIPDPPDRQVCCDFEDLMMGQRITSPWQCPEHPGLVLRWRFPTVQMVTIFEEAVEGLTHALCFPRTFAAPNELTILLREQAQSVRILLVADHGAQATGIDARGGVHGPFSGGFPDHPQIDVVGQDLVRIVVAINSETCVFQICAVLGPDPDEVTRREEMEQHLRDEMARWEQEGAVLEPHTTYRLKVVTTLVAEGEEELADFSEDLEQIEFAYFRTEGPPGLAELSKPLGLPDTMEFESGLEDLTRYVGQTVPATVPAEGEKPTLLRPVYRAYDVGVVFNEDYVDLMYRLERRDLGLYLYDNSNRPVRDVQGRLMVLRNRWGETEDLTLTESDEHWITVVSGCATVDTTLIPHHKTLTSVAEGQVLDPDTVYEARLVPLLLHQDFAENLTGWQKIDEGKNAGPSNWELRGHETLKGKMATVAGAVVSLDDAPDLSGLGPNFDVLILDGDTTRPSRLYRIVSFDDAAKTVTVDGEPNLSSGSSAWEIPGWGAVIQTSNIWGGKQDGTDPEKPGTMLIRGDLDWTDYRLSVPLRSTDDDAIGLVFRYQDAENYYRFSMDRQRKYRRLVSVIDGNHTIVAKDDFVYRQDQDYLITVEVIGASLRLYQDSALVFDAVDDAIGHGRVGLYCWGNQGARFSEVRVDDFRMEAPAVYRFQFTTSQFSNFFHHLHSFQDETWLTVLPEGIDVAAHTAKAVLLTEAPSDEEARAYEALAAIVLGAAAHPSPPRVDVIRIVQADMNPAQEALALLVRSPEPIDWKRTDLDVLQAERWAPTPERPDAVKLTDVTLGTTQPNEESVTLLLRKATTLTGHRIEHRRLPGPLAEPTGDPALFVDEFDSRDSGLLFHEAFGPNALDPYTIVDEGTKSAPSSWTVSDGHIVQTSNIYGGSVSGAEPTKPGTLALTGSASWADVRISATVRSGDDDAIGIVFRYQDAENYYRFSMDRQRSYRRLVKFVDGNVSKLWEDEVAYNLGQSYRLVVEAYGNRLLGYVDDALLFNVQDPDIEAGRVGFYCWGNIGARFEELSVEALERAPTLWQPAFADLSEVEIVDEPEAIDAPSEWTVEDGLLIQSSNIHVEDDTPHQPGTYALGGSEDWRDIQLSVRLRSDADRALGVMFRVSPHISSEADESEEAQDYNYYRFSMDKSGSYRRLVKKVGGTVTVLWQDAVPYTVGQSYELTLRAVGSELRGYLDGVPLFTVHDDDLKHGRIGLYCRANTGARFERVLVTDRTRRLNHWTIHDEGTVEAPSVWRIAGGALLQTANIYGGTLARATPDKPGTYALAGDTAWTDYRLTVLMRSDDDDAIGLIFRYVDDDNYYRLSLDAQRHYRRLVKKEHGEVTTLWEEAGGYTVGEPLTVVVDAIGPRLVGYRGTTCLFDVNDETHPAGKIGLYCWGNTGARFEQVEVCRPSLEAYALLRDHFATGDTSAWGFVDEGTVAAPSSWGTFEGTLRQTSNIHSPPLHRNDLDKKGTQAIAGDPAWADIIVRVRIQSFDNDAFGLLLRYSDEDNYYRFSMDSQRRYRRVVKNVEGSFTRLWEDDFAYEVGRTYEVIIVAIGSTLRGYLDGIPMFVVEDSDLTAGRIGLYCWGNHDTRFSDARVYPADQACEDWLLDDSFDFLIPGRWTFVDEGDHEGPSQWDVTEGELRQTSNIHGGNPDGSMPDKPGTYALAGDAAWDDYRITVKLYSKDNDAIGVMVRHQDADNHYRFSMDRERSYRRLIKKVEGEVTVLWENAEKYTVGREYILTMDCVSARLSGYLDGVLLFTVEDSDLAAGRIGLYCWGNMDARFAEVRVAAPVWAPYYTFRREEPLPAGTRVQIFAGHAADAPPEEPGIVRRFVASLDERGRLRLPLEHADLQLNRPGGRRGHARRFLPDGDSVSLDDARVLRKADGTGFFIVRPAGSPLERGQYRLEMVYRRDNQEVAPESQVYSEAGNSNPELVKIDIPWEANEAS